MHLQLFNCTHQLLCSTGFDHKKNQSTLFLNAFTRFSLPALTVSVDRIFQALIPLLVTRNFKNPWDFVKKKIELVLSRLSQFRQMFVNFQGSLPTTVMSTTLTGNQL